MPSRECILIRGGGAYPVQKWYSRKVYGFLRGGGDPGPSTYRIVVTIQALLLALRTGIKFNVIQLQLQLQY